MLGSALPYEIHYERPFNLGIKQAAAKTSDVPLSKVLHDADMDARIEPFSFPNADRRLLFFWRRVDKEPGGFGGVGGVLKR